MSFQVDVADICKSPSLASKSELLPISGDPWYLQHMNSCPILAVNSFDFKVVNGRCATPGKALLVRPEERQLGVDDAAIAIVPYLDSVEKRYNRLYPNAVLEKAVAVVPVRGASKFEIVDFDVLSLPPAWYQLFYLESTQDRSIPLIGTDPFQVRNEKITCMVYEVLCQTRLHTLQPFYDLAPNPSMQPLTANVAYQGQFTTAFIISTAGQVG